jgi:uncharacterized protein (TIGR00251 family)
VTTYRNKGIIISIKVLPNSKEFKIRNTDKNEIHVYCKSKPENNRVNREVVVMFSRLFNSEVSIISGIRRKNKKLLLKGVSSDLLKLRLNQLIS